MKRFLCCFALLAVIITGAACTGNHEANETGNTQATSDTQAVSEAESAIRPDTPDRDMDGRIFTVLCTSWTGYTPLDIIDIYVEEDSSDPVSSAAFYRNAYIEEKYMCSVEQADILSGAEYSTISRANSAGDGPYDIALIRCQNFFTLVGTGSVMNLDELPFAEFDKPWWNSEAYDSLSIVGRHFGTTSDITMNDDLATWVMYFNKGMITDNQLDSPYDLVNDEIWTFDRMYSMAETVARDIDNNGMDFENDIWGLAHIRDNFTGMLNSCGVVIAKNDEDGIPKFTLQSEESVSKIQHIFDLIYDEDTCINLHVKGTGYDETHLFMNNRCLFYCGGIYCGNTLRTMNYEYGIVPMPKYSEADSYKSSTSGLFLTLITVPAVVNNIDDLSIFIEEYTWYGYEKIRPAFYEKQLERKIAYDEESTEMLNIIFDNMIYDTGNIGNYASIGEELIWMTNTYDRNISSFLSKNIPAAEKRVEKMVKNVKKG